MAQLKNEANVMIVAAEASSCLYAQRLLEYWRRVEQQHRGPGGVRVRAFGVGSREMEQLGFEVIGRSEEMAVVGFVEVFKHFGKIREVFHRLVTEAAKRRPNVILLLDYPGFNLRLAKKLKNLGKKIGADFKIIYYISPQVWAWRTNRVQHIQKYVDQMLVILPFEKPFYESRGVNVEFVGHPLLDEISPELFDASERERWRNRYGLSAADQVVGLMPGSRPSELGHHLTVQLQTAQLLHRENPRLKFALLLAPTISFEQVKAMIPNQDLPLIFMKDDPLRMTRIVDVVLCASGTATLVVGLMERPMVIMYRMNAVTAWMAKRFVKGTPFFGLINLILGKGAVTELFQEQANPERLKDELSRLLYDGAHYRQVEAELVRARGLLGEKGATDKVAEILQRYLHN